ncbi:acidic leucine-rich nuclear phosphoprotein 32 family member A [Gossypium australe]|uniref:Acidic leucine-rich nuclear phosphoprotein 32 family member A n=1 Tax=Gossypium australe TaxID=47621 RepID=A0A5B6U496_9ROSI|nr:acidic leucine-rich nuclear phosphoprotein 32 family member A [Gossypium australe]
MESLLHSSTKIVATTLPKLQIKCGFFGNRHSFSIFPQQNSCLGRRKLLIVEAKKNKNNDNKQDSHSFIPKPDETTGFFPEAVLLKEKKVQEDGRLLPEFADEEEQELYESLNLELQSALNLERSIALSSGMTNIGLSVASKLTEYLVLPANLHLSYVFRFADNVENRRQETEKLIVTRGCLENDNNKAVKQSEEIEENVEDWLTEANTVLEM